MLNLNFNLIENKNKLKNKKNKNKIESIIYNSNTIVKFILLFKLKYYWHFISYNRLVSIKTL